MFLSLFSLCILSFANDVFCSNDIPERPFTNGSVLLSKTNDSLTSSVISPGDKDIVQTGHLNDSTASSESFRADRAKDKLANLVPTSMSFQDHLTLEQKDMDNTSVELVTVKELKVSSPKLFTIPDIIVNPRPVFVTGRPLLANPRLAFVTGRPLLVNPRSVFVTEPPLLANPRPAFVTGPPLLVNPRSVFVTEPPLLANPPPVFVTGPPLRIAPLPELVTQSVYVHVRLPQRNPFMTSLLFIDVDHDPNNLHSKLQQWPDHVCGQKGVCSEDETNSCEIGGVTCAPCRCDRDCTLYRDCCLDKYVTNSTMKPLPPFKNMSCVLGGIKPFGQIPTKSYYMVDYCPQKTASGHSDLVSLCETNNTEISYPVYSPITNTHYRNRYCASCNEEKHIVKWQVKPICKTNLNYSRIHTPKSFFDESLANELCNVLFLPPSSSSARECTPVNEPMIDSCPPDYTGELVRDGCAQYLSPIVTEFKEMEFKVYKNVLCAMCNGEQFGRPSDVGCGIGLPTLSVVYPTSVITNYDALDLKTSSVTTQCPQTEVFDTDHERCRPLLCPPGKVVTENNCLDLFSSAQGLGYTLRFVLFPDSPDSTLPNTILPRDIFSKYWQYSKYIQSYAHVGSEDSELSLGYTYITGEGKPSIQILNLTVTMHIVIWEPLPRGDLEKSLVDFVVNGWNYYPSPNERPLTFKATWLPEPRTPSVISSYGLKTDKNHTVETIPYQHHNLDVIFPPAYRSDHSAYIVVSEVLPCKMIELTPDEFEGDRTLNITVKKTGKVLKYGQFIPGGGIGVRICTDFTGETHVKSSIVSAVAVNSIPILKPFSGPDIKITLACTTVSQFFLLLTFLAYIFRPAYRDVVGQNSMAFIANVFCLQLFFQLSVSLDLPKTVCVTFGAVLHYFWMSSFFWLFFSVFNMCQFLPNPSDSNGRSFRGWIWAVSQGFPLLVVGIYIAISISLSNDVGYVITYLTSDIDVCFFSSHLGLALSFLSPIGGVFCLTLCLFGRIGWSLKGKKEGESQQRETYLGLSMSYLKITLYLTLTWIFTTLMLVINMSFLIYFSLLLHAGVGILVFVSMINYKMEDSKSVFKPRINSDAVFYSIGEKSSGTQVSDKATV